MECVSTENDLAATPRQKPKKLSKAKSTNRPARAAEFASFAEELRLELNPSGPLERLISEQVTQAAWRLKVTLDRQAGREQGDSLDPEVEGAKGRSSATVDRASRSLRDALESLDFVRSRQTSRASIAPSRSFESDIESNEWPIVPTDGLDDFLNDPEPIEEETPNWRDRLVFDFEVSDISPVVRGTWITVGHVVTLIVDGWTWADILRAHPELSEDDIRTCVAYAMAEENSAH